MLLNISWQEADFSIELQLAVDFGLIGLPNAGKSSLLNALTRAKSKVGSFPFTTLEPHLGDFHGIILGDVPGLIEGASEGRGLGHKFLRHIRRTKGLIHVISGEEPDPINQYEIVRKELLLYNKDIANKSEVVVLSKADLLSPTELKEKIKGKVSSVELNGYNYKNIDVDGRIEKKLFDGHFSIDDPNLKISKTNCKFHLLNT